MFKDVMDQIYEVLDHLEMQMTIGLENFPYCAVNNNARDHIITNRSERQGIKAKKCRSCFYFRLCTGFPRGYWRRHGQSEIQPIADAPSEVMIEITPQCNLNCRFCFNASSFARHDRNAQNKLTTAFVKKIIRHIKKEGIKIVRFTGGEPLLRKDIFELLSYAKKRGLEVRLNTNGLLIDKAAAHRLAKIADNILIPIESWNDKEEDRITGGQKCLTKKIQTIKLLAANRIPVVRAGTVAIKNNIKNFDRLAKIVLKLPIREWEFYRPAYSSQNKDILKKADLENLAEKIYQTQKKTDIRITIGNGVPFCAIKDANKMNAVCAGALYDEGRRRLVIDPRGYVKPDYTIDMNIGRPTDILGAWKNPFVKKIRETAGLPEACFHCHFRQKCCGGSRLWAKITSSDWQAPDPLMAKNRLTSAPINKI